MRSGDNRQLTNLTTQPMGATWSPDGTRIAFVGVDGIGGVPRWASRSRARRSSRMELERARVLQPDLIKSYVRLPDLQQQRMVEFAHSIGVLVATHEIHPAALVGVDNTESVIPPVGDTEER